jgi:hypothetical protein
MKRKITGTEFKLTEQQAERLKYLLKKCKGDLIKPAGAIFMQPHDYVDGVIVHAVYLPAKIAIKVKQIVQEWKDGK